MGNEQGHLKKEVHEQRHWNNVLPGRTWNMTTKWTKRKLMETLWRPGTFAMGGKRKNNKKVPLLKRKIKHPVKWCWKTNFINVSGYVYLFQKNCKSSKDLTQNLILNWYGLHSHNPIIPKTKGGRWWVHNKSGLHGKLNGILSYTDSFSKTTTKSNPGMMAYTCNLSTQERDSGGSLWVWDSLLYIVNFRPTKAVWHLFSRKKVSKILVGRSSYYLPKLDYLGRRPTWFRKRIIPSDYSLIATPMPWHKRDKINKCKLIL